MWGSHFRPATSPRLMPSRSKLGLASSSRTSRWFDVIMTIKSLPGVRAWVRRSSVVASSGLADIESPSCALFQFRTSSSARQQRCRVFNISRREEASYPAKTMSSNAIVCAHCGRIGCPFRSLIGGLEESSLCGLGGSRRRRLHNRLPENSNDRLLEDWLKTECVQTGDREHARWKGQMK